MALQLKNKRLYPFGFILLSLVALVIVLVGPADRREQLLLGMISAIGGFFYFLYRQHLDETKLFRELFVEFNHRYSTLNNQLNAIERGEASKPLDPQEIDTLYEYFNLCAEEFLFFQAGYISKDVWQSWVHGMVHFACNERIRFLWNQELASDSSDSYYGFSMELLEPLVRERQSKTQLHIKAAA